MMCDIFCEQYYHSSILYVLFKYFYFKIYVTYTFVCVQVVLKLHSSKNGLLWEE